MVRAQRPLISIVIATHNRKNALLRTLGKLAETDQPRDDFEIIVVDNASTDGTAEAALPDVDSLISLRQNKGSCAKAYGVDRARGRYIVFLDDDSYPRSGSLESMVGHFESDPKLASAGFTVHRPDGRREGGALPGVFVGCGVGFRADAQRSIGGLDRTFFMQAEEYDLCFRLVNAGWRIDVFDDLHVEHEKTADARRNERTTYYDTRNNLLVAARYLPKPLRTIYSEDWRQRYSWLAELDGHEPSFRRGVRAAALRSMIDRVRFRRCRLGLEAIEFFFRLQEIEGHMRALRRDGVRRILLADLGKNVYAFQRGAERAGLSIAAIADDRFAFEQPGQSASSVPPARGRAKILFAPSPAQQVRQYRGVPVLPVQRALQLEFDAVVVSNAAAVHAESSRQRLTAACDRPIHAWFAAVKTSRSLGQGDKFEGSMGLRSPHAASLPEIQDARAEVIVASGP